MKKITMTVLGLMMGFAVSAAWAGDSGGPLAVRPQRQEQDQNQKYEAHDQDSKYDADDQRPTPDKGSVSIPLKFFLHLTGAAEDGVIPLDSKVTISQDKVTGELEVTAESPEAEVAEVIYSKGEWLY